MSKLETLKDYTKKLTDDYVNLINGRELGRRDSTAARCATALLRIQGWPMDENHIKQALKILTDAGAEFNQSSAETKAYHNAQVLGL